jgi:alpha-tubulin suppressor-like RCC1 family protein
MNRASSHSIGAFAVSAVMLGALLVGFSPATGDVSRSPAAPAGERTAEVTQTLAPMTGITSVAAGFDFTCALTTSGGVKCWGVGHDGQLGDGTTQARSLPGDVTGLTGVVAIAAGYQHACAITVSGVKCWGANDRGQLGDGTTTNRTAPVDAFGLGSGVAALSLDRFSTSRHACALTTDGGVKCWGANDQGEIGDGTTITRTLPVDVRGLPGRATAIATGLNHSCALMADGRVACWGRGAMLGNDTFENSLTPVEVAGLSGVTGIAAGLQHTCVLMRGGVKCWGANFHGELGDGTQRSHDTPMDVSGLTSGVVAIAAGTSYTCALTEGGGLKCWGENRQGQLGDGTTDDRATPVDVQDLGSGVVAIGAASWHTCAVTDQGAVKCWGYNSLGQLGNAGRESSTLPVDVMEFGAAQAQAGFRPTGLLAPELTTYIPTPVDISTDPAVVGANLLLAALAMIPFSAATELLSRTLADHESALQRSLRPARWIGQLQQRADAALGTRLGRPALLDAIKLAGIVLFYGLIFSFLDRSWNPLSITGLYLFVSMAIAFGVVGIADDIAQWRVAKRWGLPADLRLRPASLLLAVASTTVSRLLAFAPGIMFGTPEAFEVDPAALDPQRERRLLKVGAATLIVVGLGVWLLTALTTLAQRANLSEAAAILIGGVESLLLLVFAVAVQNLFVQMLALPGTLGRVLLKWNRWLWLGGLLAVTFVFYHTMINPKGDLASALSSTSVIAFLVTIGAFLLFSLAVWVYFRLRDSRARQTKPI